LEQLTSGAEGAMRCSSTCDVFMAAIMQSPFKFSLLQITLDISHKNIKNTASVATHRYNNDDLLYQCHNTDAAGIPVSQ